MGEILCYKAGTAIQFTSGCYSDFRVDEAIVLLKDCNFIELGKIYILEQEKKNTSSWYWTSFPVWLILNSYAFPADMEYVHVDDGYDFDLHKRTK